MKRLIIILLLLAPIIGFSQYKSYLAVRDSTTAFGVSVSSHNSIVLDEETGTTWQILQRAVSTDNLSTVLKKSMGGGGGALTDYTGEMLLRDWPTGYIMTGNVEDAFEYRMYTPPTITCNLSEYIVEVGTSTTLNISGVTLNPDVMSNGQVSSTGITNPLTPIFDTAVYYLYSFKFAPLQTPTVDYTEHSYTFQATQDYTGTETGTASSLNRTVNAYYRTFWGISETDFEGATGTTIYIDTDLSSSIQDEATLTKTFTGTGYMWIITPDSWDDLSRVETSTGSVITGFTNRSLITPTTVSSAGLFENYINEGYKAWRSATEGTYTGQTYILTF